MENLKILKIKMKNNYQIILNYIKDISVEIPDAETLLATREGIPLYKMNVDIKSQAIKNKMIEVTTKLTYYDTSNNKKKTHFEILFANVIKILDEKIEKKTLEKIILCDLQTKIYPRLEKIFLNVLKDSGLPNIEFNKRIDFEDLYNKRLN